MKILVTDGMDKSAIAKLISSGHEVVEQFYPSDELGIALCEFDAVVIRSATKIRACHIDVCKETNLKLIIRGGVGVDNIDVAYAEEHGIAVRNTPCASSDSVAELALAHMFSCARFISIAGDTMRDGKWEKKAYGKGMEIGGKTLGILGYGKISRSLIAKARALGMSVVISTKHEDPALECDTLKFRTLDEVLATSDFLSVHKPASKELPIIRKENIDKMKDGVVIINTSRGSNLDENDLLEALNSGKVRAVGLDVFAEEPTKNQALLNHPAVSATPHIGAATKEAQARVGAEIVDIIANF